MMLARLRKKGTVEVFDRAPRVKGRIPQMLRQLRELIRYFRTVRRSPGIGLYVALSGGLGQVIDALYVLVARAYRKRIFVHHHSFTYINKSTLISKLLFSLLRDATHIVLSQGMAAALADRYQLDRRTIQVVSNAAFYGPPRDIARTQSDVKTPMRIGFLSNISFDKGFVEFFAVLKDLGRLAVPYRAYLAGPVAPTARSTFDRLLGGASRVDYVGPLYDDAKEQFYQRLDIFLFPTKYVNEADPLVIHEAIRSGVHVIACARGAIPELLAHGAGLAFDQSAFVKAAVSAISKFSSDRATLLRAQQLSLAQAQRLQAGAQAHLTHVISQMLAEV